MERTDNTIIYLVIGGIIATIFAYNIGVSNGKGQALQDYSQKITQEYTDEDYLEMKACYESLLNDKEEINGLTEWVGYGDTYEELTSAINKVQNIAGGKTISVLKIPYNKESGYYNCE